MPLVKIEIVKGRDDAYKKKLLETVHMSLERSLGIADWDRFQRLYELEPQAFERSGEKTDSFTMIELTLFPGRDKAKKAGVINDLTASLGRELGIAPQDVFIVMQEPPLENWGLGGRQLGAESSVPKSIDELETTQTVENATFDEERALYNITGALVKNCTFAGPADGESALKESRSVVVKECGFSLRYPMWHSKRFRMTRCSLDINTRAPLWYAEDGVIEGCRIEGPKCLRECRGVELKDTYTNSPEFGWKCRDISIYDSEIVSEYCLLESKSLDIRNLCFNGKYSFQYTENMTIRDSKLDTKDAFWHSRNVTVINSSISGEYLAWYSDGLTLINCEISGTQPLCYCKNLRLNNCTMKDTDLSFEYSDVYADIKGNIMSVKNPASGTITADSIGEVILEDSVIDCRCAIFMGGKRITESCK